MQDCLSNRNLAKRPLVKAKERGQSFVSLLWQNFIRAVKGERRVDGLANDIKQLIWRGNPLLSRWQASLVLIMRLSPNVNIVK